MRTKVLALPIVALVAACGSKPAQSPAGVASAAPPAEPPPAAAPSNPNQSNVAISEDIRKACGLSYAEAFFAYDSSSVRGQDSPVLKKLADCFTSGPLKGRQMRLVGHADPRGDRDYNYLLGQRRADNVKSAVVGAGMPSNHVSTTSRGENDATGVDDPSWAKDRRVDVVLGS